MPETRHGHGAVPVTTRIRHCQTNHIAQEKSKPITIVEDTSVAARHAHGNLRFTIIRNLVKKTLSQTNYCTCSQWFCFCHQVLYGGMFVLVCLSLVTCLLFATLKMVISYWMVDMSITYQVFSESQSESTKLPPRDNHSCTRITFHYIHLCCCKIINNSWGFYPIHGSRISDSIALWDRFQSSIGHRSEVLCIMLVI